jgi:hypothetical protein
MAITCTGNADKRLVAVPRDRNDPIVVERTRNNALSLHLAGGEHRWSEQTQQGVVEYARLPGGKRRTIGSRDGWGEEPVTAEVDGVRYSARGSALIAHRDGRDVAILEIEPGEDLGRAMVPIGSQLAIGHLDGASGVYLVDPRAASARKLWAPSGDQWRRIGSDEDLVAAGGALVTIVSADDGDKLLRIELDGTSRVLYDVGPDDVAMQLAAGGGFVYLLTSHNRHFTRLYRIAPKTGAAALLLAWRAELPQLAANDVGVYVSVSRHEIVRLAHDAPAITPL